MPIYFPEERERELPPPGAHLAVCHRVIDLGTQPGAGQFPARRQILFAWELPDDRMADGRPFGISRRYSYSSDSRSNLRSDIEGWLGRVLSANDFGKLDLTERLGSTCVLGIKHEVKDQRTFANVVSVMHPGKSVLPRMSPENPVTALSLDDRPFDQATYDALPDWIKETIARSPEYQAITDPPPVPVSTVKRMRETLQKPTRQSAQQSMRRGNAAVQAASEVVEDEIEDEDLDDKIPF